MTHLQSILSAYRATSQTEREKGSYFEELIRTYFRFEASYGDLYSDVWLFADFLRVVTVGLETMKLVNGLPKLEILVASPL